ncbi:nucleoside/nucleotide kinase family protein [Pedococcus bigeumensis]|uniref:Nucleoside/nucleotide kinase family protein n=1 Tax=Pedococcus bigeumensis TaxID=433644 RepID=A0A502CU95_9MICO|nr:nucleoside/nucleotide kinase family protein [Pedococcus bigeumensis]
MLDRCAALVGAAATSEGTQRRRRILGVSGAPGAGKTTVVLAVLAAAAVDPRLAGRVAHVPMDGYHLPNAELDRLGRRDRKGAPDTFDVEAYAATLATARSLPRAALRAPSFDHAVGEPAPDTIEVPKDADLVLTEGNYLLLPDGGWPTVRAQLDEVWFCDLGDEQRRSRLIERHVLSGRQADDAAAWVHRSDEANARLVVTGRHEADVVLVDGRVFEGSATP